MPFQTSVIFGVARDEAGTVVLRQTQTIDADVVFQGNWGGSSGSVTLNNLESDALHQPFVFANGVVNLAGSTTTAELIFDWEIYDTVLSDIQRGALANLFLTGGSITLGVELTDGSTITTPQMLEVHLRALKTADFRVDPTGPTAVPVHHPDVDADADNNPVGAGAYAYKLPAALGGGAVVPEAGTGVLSLAGTPLDPVEGAPELGSDLALTIETTVDSLLTGGTVTRTSLMAITLDIPTTEDPGEGEGGAPGDETGEGGTEGDPDGSGGADDSDPNSTGGNSTTSGGDGDGDGMLGGDGDTGGMMSGTGSGSSTDGSEMGLSGDEAGCGCHTGRASPSGMLWLTTPAALLWLRMRRPIPRDRAWWKKI